MTLPQDIQVERLPRGGIRYVLPKRGSTGMRAVGVYTLVMIFGLCIVVIAGLLLVAAGVLEPESEITTRLGALGFALFFGGVMATVLGRVVPSQLGRCAVELQDGVLREVNRFGPLRHTKSVPADRVGGLKVVRYPYPESYGHDPGSGSRYPPDWGTIQVDREGGKTVRMASAYSRDLLSPLAETLAGELSERWGLARPAAGETAVDVEDEWIEDRLARDRSEQPAGSTARLEQCADQLRITVPPSGLARGTGRMLKWWLAFGIIFVLAGTGILAAAGSEGRPGTWSHAATVALSVTGFIGGVWSIGLVGLTETATRRVRVTVGQEKLEVLQSGILGSNCRAWRAEELAAVRPYFSGYQMGRKTAMELQMQKRDGSRFGVLPMRNEAELQWLATVIRRHLGVPAEPENESEATGHDRGRLQPSKTWGPLGAILGGGVFLAAALVGGMYLVAVQVSSLPPVTSASDKTDEGGPDRSDQPVQLVGHSQTVTAAVFAPGGRTLASGSADRTVRLWDVPRRQCRVVCEGHGRFVNDVDVSPDGRLVASASADRTVRLWNSDDGSLATTWRSRAGRVLAVTFAPDGTTLAAGTHRKTVRLWGVEAGRPLATLKRHSGPVHAVAFSHDGRLLASAARRPENSDTGGEVLIWDWPARDTGRAGGGKQADARAPAVRVELTAHPGGAESLAFAPNAPRLATGSRFEETVRIWDAESGKEIRLWDGVSGPVAFSPDGQWLAVCRWAPGQEHHEAIEVRKVATGEVVSEHSVRATVTSLVFSPTGEDLASASWDMVIRLWPLKLGSRDQGGQ